MWDKLYNPLADLDLTITELNCACDMLNALSLTIEHGEMDNKSLAGAANGTYFYLFHLVKEIEEQATSAFDAAFAIKGKLAELEQA